MLSRTIRKNFSSAWTRILCFLLLGACGLLMPRTATNTQAYAQQQKADCAAAASTREAEVCFQELSTATDADVTAKVQQVLGVIGDSKTPRDGLLESQRTWQTYRKEACAQVWDFWNPGTIKNYESSRCEVVLNRERVQFLDNMYEVPLHH